MQAETEVAVIGSGMAGLTAACLLAADGKEVCVLEQNWLPGGCSSSYPRKHYVFESGATTLVGLDPCMPLRYLLDRTGIELQLRRLETPMQVHLADGRTLTRHQALEAWIEEVSAAFPHRRQRAFWEACHRISRFVWETSLRQRAFPPESVSDLLHAAAHFQPRQLAFAALAFRSMGAWMRREGLDRIPGFPEFVDEQLLITAQNRAPEVNLLFGATALCYTQYGNYYVDGGLLQLVQPLVQYLESKGGQLFLRRGVTALRREGRGWCLQTPQGDLLARRVVSAIPANNSAELLGEDRLARRLRPRLLGSAQLWGAFQMGIAFRRSALPAALHHQIHLPSPLPGTGSRSIFLSLSHPDDPQRCGPGEQVASVSTHLPDPAATRIEDKALVEEAILQVLEARGFLRREDILYQHSSTPRSWQKWTGRAWGFVGGYPQYFATKPWQMIGARLEARSLYLCGDSTYPGQGIPGACLSGIVAVEKMRLDGC
jgi:C-3',4' desaturase CrtD